MLLLNGIILLVTIFSVVRSDPDLGARLEALEARVERSEMRELQLEARAERSEKRELQLEKEIEQLKNKLAIQNSSSFFSVQFTADTTIPHGEILVLMRSSWTMATIISYLVDSTCKSRS